MKKEILEYKELLRKYFSKETAHPSCQNNYKKMIVLMDNVLLPLCLYLKSLVVQ